MRYAIVDTETTGLYKSDRVIEIAIIVLGESGTLLDEWDTLLDPGRDVGPVDIHGVSATMVAAAPVFEDVR
jgi:DNA polymerase-3 subunit epsilon